MKTICNFCKTEYAVAVEHDCIVECAVCGYTWTVRPPRGRNSFLVFLASLCALLSALVFAAVAVTRHHADVLKKHPLVANISDISAVVDAFGAQHFIVAGTVANQSDQIYGVPDLLIVSRDADGNIVARQKFMPAATLLDAGDSVAFSHTLSAPAKGVRKISVELMNNEQ
jgi:hypothetical protein